MKTVSEFLDSFFSLLNARAEYAVLRNYEGLPEQPGRDIDLIINRKHFHAIKTDILQLIESVNFHVVQYYEGSEMHSILLGKTGESNEPKLLSFDFLFSVYVRNVILIPGNKVLESRVFSGRIYHVREDMEYLSKWLYNRVLGFPYPQKYQEIEKKTYEKFSTEIEILKERILGKNNDQTSSIKTLLRSFRNHFGTACAAFVRYYFYTLKNLAYPAGISMGFTGPDGVGKTTVINKIISVFIHISSEIPLYHFRPGIIGNISEVAHSMKLKKEVDRDYHTPHRGKKTGFISSLLRLLYYSFDYLLGGILIRKLRFQRHQVIFDRYYTDIICDSPRSRIFLPHRFLYWFGKLFIPSLNYNILLTASAETILSRKRELDEEGIRSINERIDYLAEKTAYLKVLNESIPDEAVHNIMDYVFTRQHQKNQKYFR